MNDRPSQSVGTVAEFVRRVTDRTNREVPFMSREDVVLHIAEANRNRLDEIGEAVFSQPGTNRVFTNINYTAELARNLLAFAVYGWQRPTGGPDVERLYYAMKQGTFDPHTGGGLDIYVCGDRVVLAGYRHRSFAVGYSGIGQIVTMTVRVFEHEESMRKAYALTHEQKTLAKGERRRLNLDMNWDAPGVFLPKIESSATAICELGLDQGLMVPRTNPKLDPGLFYGEIIPNYETAYQTLWQQVFRGCESKVLKDRAFRRGRLAMFTLATHYDCMFMVEFLQNVVRNSPEAQTAGRPEYYLRRLLTLDHEVPKHPDVPEGVGYGTGNGSAKAMAEEIGIILWHAKNNVRMKTGKIKLPVLEWPENMTDFAGKIFVPGYEVGRPVKKLVIPMGERMHADITKGVTGVNRYGRAAARSLKQDREAVV